MPYRGHFQNGVVVLDDAAPLPDGTVVRVERMPATEPPPQSKPRDWKGAYAGRGPVPSEEDIQRMRRDVWPSS